MLHPHASPYAAARQDLLKQKHTASERAALWEAGLGGISVTKMVGNLRAGFSPGRATLS
jgi:hypothetical protein